jgi:hypothetical protein
MKYNSIWNFDTARVGYLGAVNYFLFDNLAAFQKGTTTVELTN